MPAHRRAQRGFTYLGLLFAVAVLGITLASVGVVWSTQARREREAELLWIGDQYRNAIAQYRNYGGQLPQALADLVQDPRVPLPRRFLRRLYADPMTGQVDWQLITVPGGAGNGGVAGRTPVSRGRETSNGRDAGGRGDDDRRHVRRSRAR